MEPDEEAIKMAEEIANEEARAKEAKAEKHCTFCWKEITERSWYWHQGEFLCLRCMQRVSIGRKIKYIPWKAPWYEGDGKQFKKELPVDWVIQPRIEL